MRILVTGADGFIGSHLTERLVADGHDVRAFVMYNSFNSWGWLDNHASAPPENLEVISGDIRDPRACQQAVRGCDRVAHLAALVAIPYSFEAPDSYVDTNVRGTLNMLNAARDFGIDRFVQTSTSEVYGSARYVPIDEQHPLSAQSPYAASKTAADQLALSYHAAYGLSTVVARPFNTYGPRQSARAVIPTIITQLLRGNEVRLGALHPTRDFCFVEDTVSAFVTAITSECGVGETFNFGSGYEVSIEETARLIGRLMGKSPRLTTDEQRLRPGSSEVERLSVNVAKFSSSFGWRAEFSGASGFELGLRKTIAWFSDEANLSRYKVARYNV